MIHTKAGREARAPVKWLVGGAAGASVIWATALSVQNRSTPSPASRQNELQLLERVVRLQEGIDRRPVERSAEQSPGIDQPHQPVTSMSSAEDLRGSGSDKLSQKYATLESHFSGDSRDADASTEEQNLRARATASKDYSLATVECRRTMCRLEVKSVLVNPGDLLHRLRARRATEIRKQEDGTFLVYVVRDGFSFQEILASQ